MARHCETERSRRQSQTTGACHRAVLSPWHISRPALKTTRPPYRLSNFNHLLQADSESTRTWSQLGSLSYFSESSGPTSRSSCNRLYVAPAVTNFGCPVFRLCGATWARRNHHKDCRGCDGNQINCPWMATPGCQAEAANEAQRAGIEHAKSQWRARAVLHLRVASRCRHPTCRACQQFLTHSATARWSWLAKMAAPATSVPITSASDTILVVIQSPGWPRCAILLLDPLRPARTLDMSGACSRQQDRNVWSGLHAFVDVEVSRFVRGGSGTAARQCGTRPQRFSGCDLQIG